MAGGDANWNELGILAMELYFPRQFVAQQDLERFDGAPEGKYTLGLGQTEMSFCSDREDVNSICLTVTERLLRNNAVDGANVGMLTVGTESAVDRSKSVKSVLTRLLPHADLEGADCVNACFGGTQALLHALDWLRSPACHGRQAVVVMGDVAVYERGPARCTGGAGALAVLLGAAAALQPDCALRALHATHAYDFFKPRLDCEYARVDGRLSLRSYLGALDAAYRLYAAKAARYAGAESTSLKDFDAVVFHCPYSKLVQKSLARLAFHDFRQSPKLHAAQPQLAEYLETPLCDTVLDKRFDTLCLQMSSEWFDAKTADSLTFGKRLGNIYTPSLYAGLLSVLLNRRPEVLAGGRVGLFSYGSGAMAAFYSMRVTEHVDRLRALRRAAHSAFERLSQRTRRSPQQFTAALEQREQLIGKFPYEPKAVVDEESFFAGTYYLAHIDELGRRTYEQFQPADTATMNGPV